MKRHTVFVAFISVCFGTLLPGCKDSMKEFIYEEIFKSEPTQNEQLNVQKPAFNSPSEPTDISNGGENKKEESQLNAVETPSIDDKDLIAAKKKSWRTYSRFHSHYSKWSSSPSELLADYKKKKYGSVKKIPQNLRINFDSNDLMLDDLKKARKVSLGAEYETLEQYLDELIETIEVFKPTLETLERYVISREYLADNGELLRSNDAVFIEQATAFVNAYNKFSNELERMDLIHLEENVAEMKKSGMNRDVAIQEVKLAFRHVFPYCKDPDNLNDPEVRKKISNQINEIKLALDTLHNENAKIQDDNSGIYNSIEVSLMKLLGEARVFADKYKLKDCNSLIEEYNYTNRDINNKNEKINLRRNFY